MWDGYCCALLIDSLEKLQREAIRIFSGLPRFCRSENLYVESGLQTLAERRKQHRLVLLFKILHEPALAHFQYLLPEITNHPEARHGRGIMTFYLRNPRLRIYERSFIYHTCSDWNDLPVQARVTTALATFKTLIGSNNRPRIPTLLELPRYPCILFNRLRYNCSSLQDDLFNANLSDSNRCACRLAPETLFHYL